MMLKFLKWLPSPFFYPVPTIPAPPPPPSLNDWLLSPMGEERAKSVRESLGREFHGVRAETTNLELERLSQEIVDDLRRTQKEKPMTISESIMKAAHAEIEAQPLISDIEKAARAIAVRRGHDPDLMVCGREPYRIDHVVWVAPSLEHTFPLWKHFQREAEAALNAVHK